MSKKPLHVIYIPGLGDRKVGGQRRAVASWRLWGVSSELFHVRWAEGNDWQPKFDRLLEQIDKAVANGKTVALVGASAGAAAAINAFAARKDKISGVVLIAGKVNFPERIGQKVREENPAFITAAYAAPKSLESLNSTERQSIMSIFSVKDGLLQQDDSRISGAHNRYTLILGHPIVIALQITLGAPGFIWWLKRKH